MEDLTFGEQVKIILGRKGMSIKQLAELIEEKTGKKMSRQNLTQRLGRDNFQEQDMRMIAEILECPFRLSIMSGEAQVQRRSTAALEKAATERTEKVRAAQEEQAPAEEKQEIFQAEEQSVESAQSAQAVQAESETQVQMTDEPGADERDMTIGELYDIHKGLSELEENVKAGETIEPEKAAEVIGAVETKRAADADEEAAPQQQETREFEPVISHNDVEEDVQVGEINPYTGREYQSNSVRMHPTRIGYVQVYDRTIHKWTDMTEWAFLGLQERKKALLGKAYEQPIYLD